MKGIKVNDLKSNSIKTLNKTTAWTEKIKDHIVYIQKQNNNFENQETITSYGNDKIKYALNRSFDEVTYHNKKAINNIKKFQKKFKTIKRQTKNIKNTTKKTIKNTEKITKKTVKASQRVLEQARKLAIQTAKTTTKVTKVTVKAIVSCIKAIITGIKSLTGMIASGGSMAAVAVIIIVMIALLCASIYGIFFTNEIGNEIEISDVIKEINRDVVNKINDIQNNNNYDDYTIISSRTDWKDILKIYVAKITNGTMEQEVATTDENKIRTLKTIFWDAHSITYEIIEEEVEEQGENGDINVESKKMLHINVIGKNLEEMMNMYSFTDLQRKQVLELSNDSLNSLWTSSIYGTKLGNRSFVQIALNEVGNIGGEKYWSWYGFSSRVPWCAIFVSWVANEIGYIENKTIPKFSGVKNGIDWFKALDLWQNKNYVPKSGDIIFFDWENDGKPNHVGIVEKVENNKIYTIEGNSNDECKRKVYDINSNVIYGYGAFN